MGGGWPYRNTAAAPTPLPHHQLSSSSMGSMGSMDSSSTAAAPGAAPPVDPAAAAAAVADVGAHPPLFQHVEPDSLIYSLGRSVSIGGPAAGGGSGGGNGQQPQQQAQHGHHDFVEYSLPGQMSGELGLFTRELRRYTIMALAPQTVIWRIDVGTLNVMLSQDPQAFICLQKVALSYASHRLHCLVFHGHLHSV